MKGIRIWALTVGLGFCAVLGSGVGAFAKGPGGLSGKSVLKGLKGKIRVVWVIGGTRSVIGKYKTDLNAASKKTLRDVELKLADAGFDVISDPFREVSDVPELMILVDINEFEVAGGRHYLGTVTLYLHQWVYLHRDPLVRSYASTWCSYKSFLVEKSNFSHRQRSTINNLVNAFVDDYLSANPAALKVPSATEKEE